MAVTLLRHTTPEAAQGLCYGRTDLPLAQSFEAECAVILADLPRAKVLLTSPLSRCQRLAARIGAVLGLDPQPHPDWIEMDFGEWEGQAWDAIPRRALDDWAEDFTGYAGHGGESVAQLEARVRRALDQTPDGALVVTHAGCIKAALAIRGQGEGWQARPPFGGRITL